ncbi:hypothetical protein SDC9_184597 [bioreactor metagenome]|uniref:Uncharacterized protein n=1 Tax=bioreactor metagenome TaxID=1076179 RepID=A0A645HDJ1_9ZZZZ
MRCLDILVVGCADTGRLRKRIQSNLALQLDLFQSGFTQPIDVLGRILVAVPVIAIIRSGWSVFDSDAKFGQQIGIRQIVGWMGNCCFSITDSKAAIRIEFERLTIVLVHDFPYLALA